MKLTAQPADMSPLRVEAIVTAYSSEVSQTDSTPFITANGERVHWGGIACPRDIPFGSVIVGLGEDFICNDRMALKNDGKFDVWFDTKEEAKKFGRQKVILYIYE